jgi:hypothetical protein
MRKVAIVIGLASLILLVWQGINVFNYYNDSNSDQKLLSNIDHMQRLLIFGVIGNAAYDDDNASPHKTGDAYTFTVYGKPYNHKVENVDPPQSTKFNVIYLPDDPDVQSIDPSAQLLAYKRQYLDKKTVPALTWVFIGFGLCGLVYSGIKLVKP